MAVGGGYVVAELFTLPLEFVAVIVSGQLEVALKLEIVALVAVRLEIEGELPVTAKVKDTVFAAVPPDQDTLNDDAVQAENVIPVIAVGGEYIVTAVLETIPPVPSYAVLSSLIINVQEFPDKPENVVGFVPLVENPVDKLLMV